MAWVRTDDNAPNHPKFFRVGPAAAGFWWAGLCYCNRNLTDGFIPSRDLALVYPGVTKGGALRLATVLVEAGLWYVDTDGWRVHDYTHYQPKSEQVRADREAARLRMERMRLRRNVSVTGGERSPGVTSSRPVPSRPKETTTEANYTVGQTAPPRPPENGFRREATEVLGWLNSKTGRNYRPVATNLDMIRCRLKDGITAPQLKAIISRKVREWGTDPKMQKFLRPATLFNKTNAEQYFGELPKVEEPTDA